MGKREGNIPCGPPDVLWPEASDWLLTGWWVGGGAGEQLLRTPRCVQLQSGPWGSPSVGRWSWRQFPLEVATWEWGCVHRPPSRRHERSWAKHSQIRWIMYLILFAIRASDQTGLTILMENNYLALMNTVWTMPFYGHINILKEIIIWLTGIEWNKIVLIFFPLLSTTLLWLFWTLKRGRREIPLAGLNQCMSLFGLPFPQLAPLMWSAGSFLCLSNCAFSLLCCETKCRASCEFVLFERGQEKRIGRLGWRRGWVSEVTPDFSADRVTLVQKVDLDARETVKKNEVPGVLQWPSGGVLINFLPVLLSINKTFLLCVRPALKSLQFYIVEAFVCINNTYNCT